MSSSEAWIQVEAQKAKSGKFPEKIGVDQNVYLAWIRDCDARKCQSMLVEDAKDSKTNDLLKIRALLFRGELDEAERIIQKCADAHATSETRMEVLLEQARLAAFSGNWSLCHILSAKALESKQLESLATSPRFKCMHWLALSWENSTQRSRRFMPPSRWRRFFRSSISAHYANVLRARIAARDQGVAGGFSKISELWKAFRENKALELTADMVHALVFGTVDILRIHETCGRILGAAREIRTHIVCHDRSHGGRTPLLRSRLSRWRDLWPRSSPCLVPDSTHSSASRVQAY